ncbi:hypothetical protein [Pseudonocardia sp. TRM90224]|uniref:hypothetical protein n=1 Tax=Pseudonocardia sp. TRM90224 TaxID=2812678 RepID=UPI001E518A3F|nr:hypothetical protein [Pseudonocardia sp. TRM90224]
MSEMLVNTTTAGLQHQPAVASFAGTHFLVVWADGSDATIKGQIVRSDGVRSGGELTVSAPAANNTDRRLPTVRNIGFGLVAAWVERAFTNPGPRPHVKLRRFDQDGRPIGAEIQVSTADVDPEHRPALVNLVDGGFLAVWVDPRPDQRIRAQRFTSSGVRTGAEFTVTTTAGFHTGPTCVPLEGGNYVVAWRSDPAAVGGGALLFRVFDLAGTPQSAERPVNLFGFGGGKALALLDTGRFALAHIRNGTMSDIGVQRSTVEATVFRPDATEAGIAFAASSGQGINCSSPAIAALPGGRFVVAWMQRSAETFATTPVVKARAFSDSAGPVGAEVQVSTSTAADRAGTCAASTFGFGGEAVFVGWSDNAGGDDSSDFAVRGRTLPVSGPGGLA